MIKQLNKLIDVIHASEHDTSTSVDLEMSLLKVKAAGATKTIILKHMKEFHAKLLDETIGFLIIAQMGTTGELDAFEKIANKYGLVEVVRTGKLLMTKGKETT